MTAISNRWSDLKFGEFEQLSEDDQQSYFAGLEDYVETKIDENAIEGYLQETEGGMASLSELLCKIWRFILNIAKQIVEVVKDFLIDLSKAVFEVLGAIVDGAGGLLGGLFKSPLFWLAAAGAVWYFFGDSEEEKNAKRIQEAQLLSLTGGSS